VVLHLQIGSIKLDKVSAKDSLSHGYGRDKVQALWLLPDVIPHSIVIGAGSRATGNTAYILAAPVEIGGKSFVISMLVKKSENRTGLYVHEVVLKEKLREGHQYAARAGQQGPDELNTGNPRLTRSLLLDGFCVKDKPIPTRCEPEGWCVIPPRYESERRFWVDHFPHGDRHGRNPFANYFPTFSLLGRYAGSAIQRSRYR
jgi:hypothetical protein